MGQFRHGRTSTSASEVVAYDSVSRRLFVVNSEKPAIDILDISDPNEPKLVGSASTAQWGDPTSVAARAGLIATCAGPKPKNETGHVIFLSADGEVLNTVSIGCGPDMLKFSPDGHWLLVANEGEPESDYNTDPEGSVSQIDVSRGAEHVTQADVHNLDFRKFEDRSLLDASVRIYGKGASVAQDLEPEYIAISPDSRTAWITLQENNAIAIADLTAKTITAVVGLGFKDHNAPGAWLDASDKDDRIRIRPWPVKGMYQPDAIAAFDINGQTYVFTANEGDARAYGGFDEQARVADLRLDPQAFPDAESLQNKKNLGRLRVTTANGDANGDGLFEELYSFGGRSFAIWSADGQLVFDSGDDFERITAALQPEFFNTDHEEDDFDNRSDNKGPEPEGIDVGEIDGKAYAFIALERMGGVLVYDVSDPARPVFESYVNTRRFDGSLDDSGPEGVLVIPADVSPTGDPLLAVSFEIGGTTRLFRIESKSAGNAAPQPGQSAAVMNE